MAYTTEARVLGLTPDLGSLSSTTKVTQAELALMITDIESEINVALSALGYTTPYTEVDAFLTWLGKVATEGAASTLLAAWMMDESGPQSETSGAKFERRYRDALKAIRDRTMVPASLAEASGSLPRGFDSSVNPARATMGQVF